MSETTADVDTDLACAVAQAMFAADKASQALGMRLEHVEPGKAIFSMPVRADMLNGLGICHGGITFALADTAFAFACNSRNRKTVALNCTIHFVAPGKEGDVLMAMAQEISLSGRTGIYDVTVSNQDAQVIAQFRGTAYGTSSPVIE